MNFFFFLFEEKFSKWKKKHSFIGKNKKFNLSFGIYFYAMQLHNIRFT